MLIRDQQEFVFKCKRNGEITKKSSLERMYIVGFEFVLQRLNPEYVDDMNIDHSNHWDQKAFGSTRTCK